MIKHPATPEAASHLLRFINASPTPFHAVHNATIRLENAGFQKVTLNQLENQQGIHLWNFKLKETEDWDHLSPGGKYYFTRC